MFFRKIRDSIIYHNRVKNNNNSSFNCVASYPVHINHKFSVQNKSETAKCKLPCPSEKNDSTPEQTKRTPAQKACRWKNMIYSVKNVETHAGRENGESVAFPLDKFINPIGRRFYSWYRIFYFELCRLILQWFCFPVQAIVRRLVESFYYLMNDISLLIKIANGLDNQWWHWLSRIALTY